MWWNCLSSNSDTFWMNMWKLKASFYSLANYVRIHTLSDRGHPHGKDTRLSWSGTCRSPCRHRSSQSIQLRVQLNCARMNKILSNHILHSWLVQDTKSRILLCTYPGGRILQLGYVPCRNYPHLDNSDCLHCLSSEAFHHAYECSFLGHLHGSTFLTGMFLEVSCDLCWNRDRMGIASNYDSKDLVYMHWFWKSIGPRTWCTESGWYFVYRTF